MKPSELAELGRVETLMDVLRHADPNRSEESLRYEAEGMLENEAEQAAIRREAYRHKRGMR